MLVGNSNTSGLFSAYHALSNFCASFFFFKLLSEPLQENSQALPIIRPAEAEAQRSPGEDVAEPRL